MGSETGIRRHAQHPSDDPRHVDINPDGGAVKSPIYEERLELLALIAHEALGIETLDEHPDLLAALEAAYDAGLWVGHSVGSSDASVNVYELMTHAGAARMR
jgi:hypothetical protein